MEMLTIAINSESKIPIYQQLYSFIKAEIQSGRIGYDTKLPSKRKLSSYLRISQNTIQSAYDQLIEEGYVVPIGRRGFYVCKIDNIIKLEAHKEYREIDQKTAQLEVEYDFSHHGVDLHNFPFTTWRKLTREIINEYDKELLQLGDSQGHSSLRKSIADYLHQSRGVNCAADQVIISAGTEFLLQILIQLLSRKTVYGIENPGYEKLNLVFASNQAKFRALNIDAGGMMLEKILENQVNVLCITPAHQFPTGQIMPINRRVQILNWANEAPGRYIIEDDYDSEFKYSGKPVPAMQGLDSNEKVIYMGAFSKSFSPSIRVSYMVLPNHLMKKYAENLSFIICPVPTMEQKILARFIQDGYFERHLNKMRNIYRKKRESLVKNLTELNCGIQVLGADAGLHLLLKVNNGMTEEQLVSSALQKGIKVHGINKYYFDQQHIEKAPTILLGFATMTEEEIGNAVKKLYEAWFFD